MRYACVIYACMGKPTKSKPWGSFHAGPLLMPQVHVEEWLVRRVDVAVKLRQKTNPKFSKADWQREAYGEKLDRELGKMGD